MANEPEVGSIARHIWWMVTLEQARQQVRDIEAQILAELGEEEGRALIGKRLRRRPKDPYVQAKKLFSGQEKGSSGRPRKYDPMIMMQFIEEARNLQQQRGIESFNKALNELVLSYIKMAKPDARESRINSNGIRLLIRRIKEVKKASEKSE